jgi:hypothetical protein
MCQTPLNVKLPYKGNLFLPKKIPFVKIPVVEQLFPLVQQKCTILGIIRQKCKADHVHSVRIFVFDME